MPRPNVGGRSGWAVRTGWPRRGLAVLLGTIAAAWAAGMPAVTAAAAADARATTTPATAPAPLAGGAAPTTAPALARAPKLPVPSPEAQRAARAKVERSLGEPISAVKTAPGRMNLAAELLHAAAGTPDAAVRYVLLKTTADLAADSGALEQAMTAAAQLDEAYQVDALRNALDLYQRLLHSMPPNDRALLCGPMLASIDRAVRDDRYELARRFGALAATCARASPTRDLSDRVAAATAHAAECEAEYARVARMQATLKAHPHDPAAGLAVGRFYCFAKGDWARGLPLLAGSNDTKLARLASDELAAPQSAETQGKLADGWWDYADAQPAAQRAAIRLHAGDWYGRAAPRLSGLDQLRAEQRAGADRTPALPPAAAAPGAPAQAADAPPTAGVPAPPVLAATLPPLPANPTPTPAPAFTSPLQVLQTLGPDLYPRTAADVADDNRRQAINLALKDRAAGKQATFAVVVSRVDDHDPDHPIIDVKPMRLGPFVVEAVMFFDARFKDQGPGIKVGATYAVTGTINGVGLHDSRLFFNMGLCHMVGPSAPPHSDAKVAAGDEARRRLADTAAAAPAEYTSLDQIIGLIPANLYPQRATDWTRERTITLNDMLRSRVSWKKGTFSVVVQTVDSTLPTRPVLTSKVQVGNTPVEMIMFFNADPEPAVFGAKAGRAYTITGKIAAAQFMGQTLHITMNTCHLADRK